MRNNPLIQQLSTRLADVKTQLSQAMVTYGTNHPTVKKLQSQADELEYQLSPTEGGHPELGQYELRGGQCA